MLTFLSICIVSVNFVKAAEAVEGEGSNNGNNNAEGQNGGSNEAAAEAPQEEKKSSNNSAILKWIITVIILLSIGFCLYRLFRDYWARNHREKIDIASALGLALAYISNEEDRNPNHIIKHGVGTDDDNIKQWVQDIWETYDFNDDGNLDKREIRKFIDQTFLKIGITFEFHDFDFDDFFMNLDIT